MEGSSDERTDDEWLQERLRDLGSGFQLLEHQPVASRVVAGVPQTWRGEPLTAPASSSHGLILADDMGAGKTVSVLSGLLLRETFDRAPSLVVGPNVPVVDQWHEHALRCGFKESEVVIYRGAGRRERLETALKGRRRVRLVLTDRYVLMNDLHDAVDAGLGQSTWLPPAISPLTSRTCMRRLNQLLQAAKGVLSAEQRRALLEHLERLDPARGGEPFEDSTQAPAEQHGVVEALRHERRRLEGTALPWSTVVVDEAHFLKNPTSWWGMHGALLSLHARRFVACTGTPFNTRACDLGQMVTLVDVRQLQAESWWWNKMIGDCARELAGVGEAKAAAAKAALAKQRASEADESLWGMDLHRANACSRLELQTLPMAEIERRVNSFKELVALGEKLEEHCRAARELQEWRGEPADPRALLRREKAALNLLLPEKHIHMIDVEPTEAELKTYHIVFSDSVPLVSTTEDGPLRRREFGEQAAFVKAVAVNFLFAWDEWEKVKAIKPMPRRLERYWFQSMMTKVQSMRLLLTHPAVYVACGGRELTAGFAPSRMSRDFRPRSCHLCGSVALAEVEDEDGDDDAEDEEDVAIQAARRLEAKKQAGELVPYPRALCCAQRPHWVHRACLQRAQASAEGVPPCKRCSALKEYAQVGAAASAEESASEESASAEDSLVIRKGVLDYHGASLGGFRLSSKMVEVRRLVRLFPADERVLIFSSFKGFLDLLEAMLHADGARCERFDGDVEPEERIRALKAFKADAGIKVLLSTPQSGGVGLNIVEANRVIFTDRHLNPVVQQQAMDRVYRFGQRKEVHVYFLDAVSPIHAPYGTFDEFVRDHNGAREQAARIILGDGTSIGTRPISLGESLQAIGQRVDLAVAERNAQRGRWAPDFKHPPPGTTPTHRPDKTEAIGGAPSTVKAEAKTEAAAPNAPEPVPTPVRTSSVVAPAASASSAARAGDVADEPIDLTQDGSGDDDDEGDGDGDDSGLDEAGAIDAAMESAPAPSPKRSRDEDDRDAMIKARLARFDK